MNGHSRDSEFKMWEWDNQRSFLDTSVPLTLVLRATSYNYAETVPYLARGSEPNQYSAKQLCRVTSEVEEDALWDCWARFLETTPPC